MQVGGKTLRYETYKLLMYLE